MKAQVRQLLAQAHPDDADAIFRAAALALKHGKLALAIERGRVVTVEKN